MKPQYKKFSKNIRQNLIQLQTEQHGKNINLNFKYELKKLNGKYNLKLAQRRCDSQFVYIWNNNTEISLHAL